LLLVLESISCKSLTEVIEELCKDIESQESMAAKFIVRKSDDAEKKGKYDESHDLDGLASNGVAKGNCHPVTWNGTGANQD
jgi:hypothetical protein